MGAGNRKHQQTVGNLVAANSNSIILQKAATNEHVQQVVGHIVQNTATNRYVQQKAGEYISTAAEDPEFQRKMGRAVVSTGGFALQHAQNEHAQMVVKAVGSQALHSLQDEKNQAMMFEVASSAGQSAWIAAQDEEN